MKNIDFMLDSYRHQVQGRRSRWWQMVIVCTFTGLFLVCFSWQSTLLYKVQQKSQEAGQRHMAAIALQQEHKRLQEQLAQLNDVAELYDFLEHPWPRTQVMRQLTSNLPNDMAFRYVGITAKVADRPIAKTETSTDAHAKPSTARQDLNLLQNEVANRQLWVSITGETSDSTLVHTYAYDLSKCPLFEDVKLESVENSGEETLSRVTFRLRAMLKPGYGTMNGPTENLSQKFKGRVTTEVAQQSLLESAP
jgi:hypothetical protein